MEEIIKYFSALEARLAEQDARIAKLEGYIATLETRVTEQDARLAALEAQPTVPTTPEAPEETVVSAEPEIEVELVFDEDEPEVSEEPIAPVAPEEPVAPVVSEDPIDPAAPVEPIAPAAPTKSAGSLAPVDDLRKAISLGDRFLFTRELFANQGEKLQIAVEELNRKSSLAEAYAYIDRFGWDKESKAYELFENALKRRFS